MTQCRNLAFTRGSEVKVNSSNLTALSDVMVEHPVVNPSAAKNVNFAAGEGVPSQNDGWSPDLEIERSIEGATYKRPERRWSKRYRYYLRLTDLLIVSATVVGAQLLRFGNGSEDYLLSTISSLDVTLTYTILSILLILGWMLSLAAAGTREPAVIGAGSTEYRLVIEATVRLFGVLAIVDLLFKLDISRGYLLISFPTGLILLLTSRWLGRKWLSKMRGDGRCLDRALIIGESVKASHVAHQVAASREVGLKIAGIATSSAECDGSGHGERIFSTDFSSVSIVDVIDEVRPDTIILTGEDRLGPRALREVGWAAEERSIEVVVAHALTDIAGPRIHTRPVAGLPFIYIEYAEFSGFKYWAKRVSDIVASSLLIVLLSPILLITALLVKSDGGPVIFRQERVGRDGTHFKMLKFRSMVVDAEAKLANLEAKSDGNKVMFKMKDDPRVTKVGRVLRRYSIDELPQLFNVLGGTMSLVGPRPALPKEVASYDEWAMRRLLVKPGITGLWQVSGRSNLSWEDSVRLDQYYVENWSLISDALILVKTVKAVLASDGAY